MQSRANLAHGLDHDRFVRPQGISGKLQSMAILLHCLENDFSICPPVANGPCMP